jgi:hypothetical protein
MFVYADNNNKYHTPFVMMYLLTARGIITARIKEKGKEEQTRRNLVGLAYLTIERTLGSEAA